jgi:hypothetical protein
MKKPLEALERLTEAALALYIDADDRAETTGDDGQEHDDWRELRLALIDCGALPNAPRPSRFDAAVEVVRRMEARDLLDDAATLDVISRRFRDVIDREMKQDREARDELDELFEEEEPCSPSR